MARLKTATTTLTLNPVTRADLVAVLGMTPNERRLAVAAAFLGFDSPAKFMSACGETTPAPSRFETEAVRLRIADALDIPYSRLWER